MSKKYNIIFLIFTMFLAFNLSSCSSTKDVQKLSYDQSLKDTKWQLESLNEKAIKKIERVASINFDKENKVYGNLGCNNFFGKFESKNDLLKISQIGSTMMMCQDMSIESLYSKILENVKKYKVEKEILIFFDKDNKEIAKFKRV
ncbi:META domain-containing protein [Aliarcobacter cibarius]|jgi:heat shock protein HslJ|uniref:META domain-containing protein n=1 Tax=Aliarcobacter cibarius TaxID=255507 RepID=A0ABY2V5S4_9BACT|nr:META domain-containing protein [Aliarcobacter cibarius]QEZ89907.1 META domain-containing protein [Aliarcobacter cibarius]TLT00889.1 META domain-containing protein [Aliarcobacter cibarius]TLT01459.1 META domain-containing protein [Aliarcobacter cibarius]TLT02849.1 META domain-containing protein [Aliarcobacter cibarius]